MISNTFLCSRESLQFGDLTGSTCFLYQFNAFQSIYVRECELVAIIIDNPLYYFCTLQGSKLLEIFLICRQAANKFLI